MTARAICGFCDTDFLGTDGPGGGQFVAPAALADALRRSWGDAAGERFVVFTGGEPTLQLDDALIDAAHAEGFTVAIETNGTRAAPLGVDWICVSPKAGAPLAQRSGDELKVVVPQTGLDLSQLERLDFRHRFVQPCDGPEIEANTRTAMELCLERPAWRLSLQIHKLLGIR